MDTTRTPALRSITIMANGDHADFDAVIAPEALNHESQAEPPACRVRGPDGFYATALWLRTAFVGLHHQIEHVVAEDDLVAVDTTISGRHVAPFVVHDGAGEVETVWAPTGKAFAVRQSHWIRVADGLVTEHWAIRDDLRQGFQLGWVPPTPRYALRCALAKRRAIRASRTG